MENNEMLEEKVLSNGDLYYGDFKGMLPHGKGRYTWANNKAVYEGEWELGKMTGKGKIFWESGARYEGDISGGYLHGCGTFTKPDGSVYTGYWRMNIQHGVGRKEYGNSDVYEGMWKEGVREGSGRYTWNSGHTYVGNWKGGKMWGRGIMKWVNGDLYDGSWLNGLRHESGIYRFADGAYYFGTWNSGLKEGKGTYYPAGSKHPSLKKLRSMGYNDKGKNLSSRSLSLAFEESRAPKTFINRSYSEKVSMGGVLRNSGRISSRAMSLDENWSVFYSEGELGSQESSFEVPEVPEERQDKMQDDSSLIYEREYMQGVLIKERIRNYQELTRKTEQKNKFHGKESKKRPCMDMPLRDRSFYLKLNLQLGIRYTVGKITPVPMREVRSSDFGERARIRMYFPRKGSQFTPPHYSIDFYWKDYCPMVFRNLREMFKLDAAEYMMSICGDDGLTEISSPGKSGSIFYNSHDGRFVIKTLKKSELKVLLKMLPHYYNHVGRHENTLITKFFGLHRIKLKVGRKVRFVVMGNMFCTELQIHRRYDLKGSSLGRFTDKEKIHQNTTLKDLDLAYEFHMDKFLREAFFKQISLDCMFLESQQIIDYSLLLGLHFRAPEQLKALLNGGAAMVNEESSSTANGPTSRGEVLIPPKGLLLVTHEPSSVSTTPGPHIRGSTLRAFSLGDKEVDLLLPGTARIVFMPTEWLYWQSSGLIAKVLGFWHRLRVQLGVNMPAQANRNLREDGVDSAEIELFEVYDVVLYMGIIDILQEYNLKKKIEHAYKSLWYDPLSISVIEPKLYAKRFISFLERVFPANAEGYQ